MPDNPLVDRAAGLEVRLGGIERRHRLGATGPRLRDIGLGDFAHAATGLGGVEFGGQDVDVRLTQAHQCDIAHHVDIGSDCFKQRRVLDLPQVLATGAHDGFGLAHGVDGPKAGEHLLRDVKAVATWIGVAGAGGRRLGGQALRS